MQLFNCYHPKLVKNQYSGEMVLARCGKCPACLNARAAQWVQRLDEEMLQHKFTYFATFQYDELHVNQLILLRKEDNPNTLPTYIDSDTGELFSLGDVISEPDKKEIKYCYDTKVLLVHNVRDFQLFIKRLRKKIHDSYNTNIRYFCTFEYGPQTFRPHLHTLFFFDSPLLSKNFVRLLSQTWDYGLCFDPHLLNGSASQYVASYVNSFAHLPKIYLHPRIRQKSVFSKRPPLGSYNFTEEKFRELFNSEVNRLTLFKRYNSTFCDVPLWRCLQSRLYPKIVCFDRISHFDRVLLYQKGQSSIYRDRNYERIKEDLSSPFWLPYFESAFKTLNKYSHKYDFNLTSLSRFVGIVLRVCDNATKFGVSIEEYVTKIENFYEQKQKSDLKEWYYLQNEYFKEHPISDFLLLCSNFYIMTKGKTFSTLTPGQQFYLNFYTRNNHLSGDIVDFNYGDSHAYRQMLALHNKIYSDNTKVKHGNDYVNSHKDKFNNIITYNQTL